jgi:hypothetical protein
VHPTDDGAFEVEIIGDLAALTNAHISERFAQCSRGGSGARYSRQLADQRSDVLASRPPAGSTITLTVIAR